MQLTQPPTRRRAVAIAIVCMLLMIVFLIWIGQFAITHLFNGLS